MAVNLLQLRGHKVTVANNGQEALEILARDHYDMVLMDVQMPVMDGLEATRQLRQKEVFAGGHVPIIAMTAHAMKGDRQRCLDAGMDAYLPKPIRADDLYEVIESMVPNFSEGHSRTKESGTHLDRAFLLQQCGGDLDTLTEIVDVFTMESAPTHAADSDRHPSGQCY